MAGQPAFEQLLALLAKEHDLERRRVTHLRDENTALREQMREWMSRVQAATGHGLVRGGHADPAADVAVCRVASGELTSMSFLSGRDGTNLTGGACNEAEIKEARLCAIQMGGQEASYDDGVMPERECNALLVGPSAISSQTQSLGNSEAFAHAVQHTLRELSDVDAGEEHPPVTKSLDTQKAIVDVRDDSHGFTDIRCGGNGGEIDTSSSDGLCEGNPTAERDSSPYSLRKSWCPSDNRTEDTTVAKATDRRSLTSGFVAASGQMKDCVIGESSMFMLRPTSSFRIAWDLFGVMLIGYDLIVTPLQAFDLPETCWSFGVACVGMAFWCLDIVATFFVGYHSQGQLVMSQSRVARQYLVSWFSFDIVLVAIDVHTTLFGSDESVDVFGIGRAFRAVRAINILRLLRFIKLKHIVNQLQELINSEHTFLLVGMCRVLCIILLASHVAACGWFFVGTKWTPDSGDTWVVASGAADKGPLYQYLTAFHWILCLFSPASINVHPQNTAERMATVILLIFFLVTVPSLVSSVTTNVTKLRNVSAEQWKKCWVLRCYLKQRNVSKDLSMRILRYVEFVYNQQSSNLLEDRVDALRIISESLRRELRYEMCSPGVSVHPCMKLLCNEYKLAAQHILNVALAQHELAVDDVLFTRGSPALGIYFVTNGTALYDRSGRTHCLEERDWLSEMALWSSWHHTGNLVAVTECAFVSLSGQHFGDVLQAHPIAWPTIAMYATRYVDYINSLPRAQLSDLRCSDAFLEQATSDFTPSEKRWSSNTCRSWPSYASSQCRTSIISELFLAQKSSGRPCKSAGQTSDGELPRILGSRVTAEMCPRPQA
eukprot:TRINITY_DN26787_c0_g1_i1.p1 TRINITY_DN26787_c0_g1~~TRINITY_DN26787_c0_g1_i1.p1  ORF type:complete len:831 (+),score=81.29 TRINITY_DN26787_c0_g1_i1:159-2651(+)